MPRSGAALLQACAGADHNFYGPTETDNVDVDVWSVPSGRSWQVPIGRPIANTRVYVLDERLEPVPVGWWGSCTSAGRVARGYLNRAELTAERFVATRLEGRGERLYRTGMWGGGRGDGEMEFLGRMDQQVKMRVTGSSWGDRGGAAGAAGSAGRGGGGA